MEGKMQRYSWLIIGALAVGLGLLTARCARADDHLPTIEVRPPCDSEVMINAVKRIKLRNVFGATFEIIEVDNIVQQPSDSNTLVCTAVGYLSTGIHLITWTVLTVRGTQYIEVRVNE
jgi:hypothetical protein